MAVQSGIPIALASRDSLLALAQTIEAAIRLKAAGFAPVIRSMKTAGDLKLDAALYDVAAQNRGKEGRAFFTRELDDALIGGRADAAVHSFKDLPAERVEGVSDPVFFSEVTGADVLLSRENADLGDRKLSLKIGTSSLRRIHQLGLLYPGATTSILRGNIVTRLRKLGEADQGIDAILIAAAGMERLKKFCRRDPTTYADFLDKPTLSHIEAERRHFEKWMAAGFFTQQLGEPDFPTAPGQGVLALQLGRHIDRNAAAQVQSAFAEHENIARRVLLERAVMTGLAAGCHAPLGVSAFRSKYAGEYDLAVCYAQADEPPRFTNSVYLKRIVGNEAHNLISEIKTPFETCFWWGFRDAPQAPGMEIVPVLAVEQAQLPATVTDTGKIRTVFVASPAVFDFLAAHPFLLGREILAAGAETCVAFEKRFPGKKCRAPGKGFAEALENIPAAQAGETLWLGSRSGEARARRAAEERNLKDISFIAVYENRPRSVQEIEGDHPALIPKARGERIIHAVTSAAAAAAFAAFATAHKWPSPLISVFGDSAEDYLRRQGLIPYHRSDAGTFTGYAAELVRSTACLKQKE